MTLDTIAKESAIKMLDVIFDSESTVEQVANAQATLVSLVAPEIMELACPDGSMAGMLGD